MNKFFLILIFVAMSVSAVVLKASAATAVCPCDKAEATDSVEYIHIAVPRKWSFGARAGLNLGDSMDFSRVRFTSGGETVESSALSYNGEPSLNVGIEAFWSGVGTWGIAAGVSVDSKHALNSAEFSSVGGKTLTQVNDAKIQIATVYTNFVYRFTKWYVPVGLNFLNVTVENPSLALRDLRSELGAQFGGGYFFNERYAIEFLARMVAVRGASQTDGSVTSDVRYGSISTLQLSAKVYL